MLNISAGEPGILSLLPGSQTEDMLDLQEK